MKNSPFRNWVQSIWIENKEEHLTYHENPYTIEEYWEQYKYWLKQQYRKYRKNEKDL
jgi:hypothetical protein